MPFAIVSDVHGNLPALEAVVANIERRGIERVVHGGDLALVGCQGAEVVDLVRQLGWPGIVGNTDELLWRPERRSGIEEAAPGLRPLLRLLFEVYAPATHDQLGEERIAWLRELPEEHREGDVALVHASPGNLWQAPMPEADDAELLATYEPLGAAVAVYGHIHRPYVRVLDGLTVANSGSVGNPFDGDPRAGYLLVDDDKVEVVRVEYDIEREVNTVLSSGYPDAERIAAMRRRGEFVAPSS